MQASEERMKPEAEREVWERALKDNQLKKEVLEKEMNLRLCIPKTGLPGAAT